MLEKNVNSTVKTMDSRAGRDILTKEDKSSLRNFAQKVHKMDIEDVGRLHNGFADSLSSEQKDIVAYELKLREYDILKRNGINPKVDFLPENMHPNPQKATDIVSRQAMQKSYQYEADLTEDLLERSKEIIENTYIPIESSQFHKIDGGGINALFHKIVAVDDNGTKIKVNNAALEESYRKNYLKTLSDVTGIDYTCLDDNFYDDFTPMGTNQSFQDGKVVDNESFSRQDSIDFNDYEDDDDEEFYS